MRQAYRCAVSAREGRRMNATACLQRQFQDFVIDKSAAIMPSVVDGPRAGTDRRLAIYANAYRARLTEVLDSDYPALHALAGDALFRQIALAYIAAYPSSHPNARWFGRHLLSFLMDDGHFSGLRPLIEMASFEWAMSLAFDAADDAVLTLPQLAEVPADDWPNLRFSKHPSVQRLELATDVPSFWLAVQRGDTPPPIAKAEQVSSWIVWRRELSVFYRSLEKDETWALDAAFAGRTFAELCDGLDQWHPPAEVPLRAVEMLKRWIGEGLLVANGMTFEISASVT